MKVLLIHCDYFSFAITEKTKFAEMEDICKSCGIRDALVVFTTVEKRDEANVDSVIEKSVREVVTGAKRIGVNKLVVYPFVHLSSEIAKPEIARDLINKFHKKLTEAGYEVVKAPFGWEKVFSLTSKGHPLSESFKTVEP
jgi:threonyl-tRNA synthetase